MPRLQVHAGHEEGLVLEDASARLMTIRKNVFQVRPPSPAVVDALDGQSGMPTVLNTVVSHHH